MKNIDNYILENKTSQEVSPSTLFISLYLVVLAFFILLNSISEKDNVRTENAINSLNQVFSSESGMSDLKMNTPAIFEFSFIVSNYFDQIEGLIQSSFQLLEIDTKRTGNKLITTIPIKAFFKVSEKKLGLKQKEFLNKIADIVNQEEQGVKVQIDFTIDSYSFLSSEGDQTPEVDISRNIRIIEHLLKARVPLEFVTGGIKFNDQQNINISFTISEAGKVEN